MVDVPNVRCRRSTGPSQFALMTVSPQHSVLDLVSVPSVRKLPDPDDEPFEASADFHVAVLTFDQGNKEIHLLFKPRKHQTSLSGMTGAS